MTDSMQIVIEIPKELKRALDDNEEYRLYTESIGHVMLTAIKNGTPIPERHGDLKDVDKLRLSDFELIMCNGSYKEALQMLLSKIQTTPTIISATKEGDLNG